MSFVRGDHQERNCDQPTKRGGNHIFLNNSGLQYLLLLIPSGKTFEGEPLQRLNICICDTVAYVGGSILCLL